jgi:hypothetical protein
MNINLREWESEHQKVLDKHRGKEAFVKEYIASLRRKPRK